MGKSFPVSSSLPNFSRTTISNSKFLKPRSKNLIVSEIEKKNEEANQLKMANSENQSGIPLSVVVSDCVKRWFQDTLKEARAGDSGMQILIGQMYLSGYGVTRDEQKGRAWISKAARSRSSAWLVSDKRPGYNASDSDSDEDDNNPKLD